MSTFLSLLHLWWTWTLIQMQVDTSQKLVMVPDEEIKLLTYRQINFTLHSISRDNLFFNFITTSPSFCLLPVESDDTNWKREREDVMSSSTSRSLWACVVHILKLSPTDIFTCILNPCYNFIQFSSSSLPLLLFLSLLPRSKFNLM